MRRLSEMGFAERHHFAVKVEFWAKSMMAMVATISLLVIAIKI